MEGNYNKYKDKRRFIVDILDYSIKKEIDLRTKKRIIYLIGKEIEKPTNVSEDILERLRKVEENVNSSEHTNEEKEGKIREEDSVITHKIKHTPITTVECLKKFKYNNETGFKELVHTPKADNYTLDDYDKNIQKANESFKKLKNIPYGLWKNIEELLKLMENEGKLCFEKTKKHPYQNMNCDKVDDVKKKYSSLYYNFNSDKITNLIQGFKKNYRFDIEKSESSQLKDLIINVFNKQSFQKSNIRYEFDSKFDKDNNEQLILLKTDFDKDFSDNAIFFTWVPNIRSFLKEIAEDILKHGNINGNQNYQSYEKEVIFHLDRVYNDIEGYTEILFIIFDKESVVGKDKELFYKQIKEKSKYLKSLCDWSIEADVRDVPCRIQILPETKEPFKELNDKVGGLKHVLKFYEI